MLKIIRFYISSSLLLHEMQMLYWKFVTNLSQTDFAEYIRIFANISEPDIADKSRYTHVPPSKPPGTALFPAFHQLTTFRRARAISSII